MRNRPFIQQEDSLNILQMITTDPIGVDVNITHTTGEHDFFLVPDSPSTSSLSPSVSEVTGPDDRQKGIRVAVTSDPKGSFALYGINNASGSVDGYLGLPCINLATSYDYYAISVPTRDQIKNNSESAFLIVPCYDETSLSITVEEVSGGGITAVTLNKGESYYVSRVDDLSGSYVNSDKPIAFFSGHECWIANDFETETCNHLVEQLPPTISWGNVFLIAPLIVSNSVSAFVTRVSSVVKIVAQNSITSINVTCMDTGSENANFLYSNFFMNEPFNFTAGANSFCSIESSHPVLVVQLPNPTPFAFDFFVLDNVFMTLVPAVSQYRNNITVVPPPGELDNWITVFVPANYFDVGDIDIGGLETTVEQWEPIPCSSGGVCGYAMHVSVKVQSSLVRHMNANAALGVILYGHNIDDTLGRASYGYPAGMSLAQGKFLCRY